MKSAGIISLVLMIFLAACEKKPQERPERGYIIRKLDIREYTPGEVTDLLTFHNFDVPFELKYNVKAVKLAYSTPEPDGDLVNATGGIYLPVTEGKLPVILFQHGTQTHRHLVPSLGAGNSDAGLAGAIAASMGYICVAADYLGLGESYIVPPYLLAENSATTVIDMLRASYRYLEDNGIQTDGSLYLAGYSQGGHVTLATHREIEKNYAGEFTVTASAPLAGPYDLRGTMDSIIIEGWYKEPILFAYMMNSYNYYYRWDRMAEIFKEPYASEIPGYFDGTSLMNLLRENLPHTIDSLLTENFIRSYLEGTETDLINALNENTLLDYVPSAPMLLIQGTDDRTVPPFNSENLLNYYLSNGKSDAMLNMVEGDHETAAEAAIIAAMTWIESLRNPDKGE